MSDDPIIHGRLALSDKGSDALLQQITLELASLGFQVDQLSARGVSFSGTKSRFERAFAATVKESNSGWTFAERPQIPDSVKCPGASVYLPQKPTYFR